MLQTSLGNNDLLFILRKALSSLPVVLCSLLNSYRLVTFPDYICSLQNLEGKIFQVLTPNYQKSLFKTKKTHLFISSNPRES